MCIFLVSLFLSSGWTGVELIYFGYRSKFDKLAMVEASELISMFFYFICLNGMFDLRCCFSLSLVQWRVLIPRIDRNSFLSLSSSFVLSLHHHALLINSPLPFPFDLVALVLHRKFISFNCNKQFVYHVNLSLCS